MKRPLNSKCLFALSLLAAGGIGVRLAEAHHRQTSHFRVLLIGIGPYNTTQQLFVPLTGDKDMARLEPVLKAKFPQAEIDDSLCKAGSATKAAIIAAINALAAKSQPSDAIYIAFAGHGTQVPESTESTGVAQAFVPYDVKTQPANDPSDPGATDVVKSSVIDGPEFNALIKNLRDRVKGPDGLANITFTFDCCHSGSISRGDWLLRGASNHAVKGITSGNGNSVTEEPDIKGLVCLSAAQAGQSAWQNGRGGLFTNALLDAFQNLDTTNGGHSYQSLFIAVRTSMADVNPGPPQAQVPDFLGEGGRELFSSKPLPLADSYPVATPPDPNGKLTVKMLAGAAWGIHKGDIAGIFKPGTEDLQATPLAKGTVSNPGPASSFITLDGPPRTDAQIKQLSGNVALVLKAAPAGQLKILVKGKLSQAVARSLSAQPDMELVAEGAAHDIEIVAPASGATAWTLNVAGTPEQTIPAADFDDKVLGDLRQIQRFRAVQAFGSATKNPEVIVEMRLVPITVDDGKNFTGFAGAADKPIEGPVNSKRPFLIQVRAYSLSGSTHVKGKFDPYIALINSQPNWVVHQVWPGVDGSAASVPDEEHKLIADNKWRTLKTNFGLLPTLADKGSVETFGCDSSDGLGAEYWEIVATPTSIDYNPFLAVGASKSVARGAELRTPDEWSTATVKVVVVEG